MPVPAGPNHRRWQILQHVKTLLLGGVCGSNVFVGRTLNLEETESPCLLVFGREEEGQDGSMGTSGRTRERGMRLVVEGRISQADDPEELMNYISMEVERAIASDETFSNMARSVVYTGMTMDARATDATREGAVVIMYSVEYETPSDNPSVGA